MTPYRRDRFLRVVDGCAPLVNIMAHWNKLHRCDEILEFCIRSHLTGKDLLAWMRAHYGQFIFAPAQEILRRIDRDAAPKTLLLDRDFRRILDQ